MNPLFRSVGLTASRAALIRPTATSTISRASLVQRRLASTTTQPVEWEQKEVDPQLQDYPQIPALSYQRKAKGNWDDPQEKRNFGEPVCISPCFQCPNRDSQFG